MATPDEIALYEQTLGRPLAPEEIASLDAELGAGMSPAPLDYGGMSSPDVPTFYGDAPGAGMQIPGIGANATGPGVSAVTGGGDWAERKRARMAAMYGGQPTPVTPDYGMASMEETPLPPSTPAQPGQPGAAPDGGPMAQVSPESPFPTVDLSVLRQRQRQRGGGGGAGGRYAREADAAREDVEAARGAQQEAMGGVRQAAEDAKNQRLNAEIDRDLAEQDLEDQYKPKRDAADELYQSKIRQLEEANKAAAGIEVKDRRNFGQKLAGAIAAGFGAMAQAQMALAGGSMENIPARIVEQSIERDLQEQRTALANARDTAEAAKTELGAAYQHLGDVREAEAVARQALRQKYMDAAQEIRAGVDDQERIGQIDMTIAGLDEKNALEREAIAQRRQAMASQAAARKRAEDQANAQRTLEAIQRYEQSQNMAGGLKVADPQKWSSVTGGDPRQESEQVRTTLEAIETNDKIASLIDQVQELRAGWTAGAIPWTDANARMRSLKMQILYGIKSSEHLGALDAGAVATGNDVMGELGSFSDMLTGSAGEALEAYRGTVAEQTDTLLRSRGLQMRSDTNLQGARRDALRSRTEPLVK